MDQKPGPTEAQQLRMQLDMAEQAIGKLVIENGRLQAIVDRHYAHCGDCDE